MADKYGRAGWAIFVLCFSGLRPLFLLTPVVVGVQGGSALSSTSPNIGFRAEAHASPEAVALPPCLVIQLSLLGRPGERHTSGRVSPGLLGKLCFGSDWPPDSLGSLS